MTERSRHLEGKGEFDYDYLHDILFFKIKDRIYDRSIDLDNFVIDLDNEDFIVGFQIFDASKYFGIKQTYLRDALKWKLQTKVEPINEFESKIEIRLVFQIKIRNKILQPEPIITQNIRSRLEESNMICVPV